MNYSIAENIFICLFGIIGTTGLLLLIGCLAKILMGLISPDTIKENLSKMVLIAVILCAISTVGMLVLLK